MLDPNEAPEGFTAAEVREGCNGCHFLRAGRKCPAEVSVNDCFSQHRTDRTSVIFVKSAQC